MPDSSVIFEEPLAYRSAEIGADGTLHISHVADLLQDIAGRHASTLGFGMDDLGKEGHTWALVRLKIILLEDIVDGASYKVRTWPSGTERLWAYRRYRILKGDATIGEAISQWMVLNRETHRPVRLPSYLVDRSWHVDVEPAPVWTNFNQMESKTHIGKPFDVRFTEIDINNHVNNAHYLYWAANAIDPDLIETGKPTEVDIQFEAECLRDDVVRVETRYTYSEELIQSSQDIVNTKTGKRMAFVQTLWQKKIPGADWRRGLSLLSA